MKKSSSIFLPKKRQLVLIKCADRKSEHEFFIDSEKDVVVGDFKIVKDDKVIYTQIELQPSHVYELYNLFGTYLTTSY